MTDTPNFIIIEEAPNPRLRGKWSFKHPAVSTKFMIDRRVNELCNIGRPTHLPRLPLTSFPANVQDDMLMLATLEYVLHTCPEGCYTQTDPNSEYVLNLLALDSDDIELVLWPVYAAFLQWRQSFRGTGKPVDPGTQGEPPESPDGLRRLESGNVPILGAGNAALSPDPGQGEPAAVPDHAGG